MRVRSAVLLAVAVVALASATGCAALDKLLTPSPKVVTEEATVAVSGAPVVGELSADTPRDLPLWPEASVVESVATGDSYSLTLTTTDAYDDVVAGVATGFDRAGWDVATEDSGDDLGRMSVVTISSQGQEGFITVTELEGGTTQLDYAIVSTE